MQHTNLEIELVKQHEQLAQAIIALAQGVALKPILQHVGELSKQLTGARYAMLSYIEDGEKNFIPLGMSEEQLALLDGNKPEGIGLLGMMWDQHEVVRVNDIHMHPKTVGVPANPPAMTTFLGAPIMFADEVQGVIYLTEKEGGRAFTPIDETMIRTLASACAVAISNATRIEKLQARNAELEQQLSERNVPDGD